jgi:hypothetical protein
MADRELAQKVLDQITAHPELHTQLYFARKRNPCDTAMCVAGWAVQLDDPAAVPVFSPGFIIPTAMSEVQLGNGDVVDYAHAGQNALGITSDEAEYLFDEDRTTDEVVTALTELATFGTFTVPYVDEDSDDDEEDEDWY